MPDVDRNIARALRSLSTYLDLRLGDILRLCGCQSRIVKTWRKCSTNKSRNLYLALSLPSSYRDSGLVLGDSGGSSPLLFLGRTDVFGDAAGRCGDLGVLRNATVANSAAWAAGLVGLDDVVKGLIELSSRHVDVHVESELCDSVAVDP